MYRCQTRCFRVSYGQLPDQPSFKWNHLIEVKLIYINKLAQLSASKWTRVALDQPSFNWLQLNEVKLIYFHKLAQLSASKWTRVALAC